MPSEDYILWFDLETTGNRDSDHILEAGFVLTNHQLTELSAFNALIAPPADLPLRTIDPVVLAMHSTNGLWYDLKHEHPFASPPQAEGAILQWLAAATENTKEHIPAAGSGISHFDRKYFAKYFPHLNRRLTYWNLDIGVVRRMTTMLTRVAWNMELVQDKPHRALEDTRLAIDETRMWREAMNRGLT